MIEDLHLGVQHGMGERKFWRSKGFEPNDDNLSPLALARELWRHSQANDHDAAMKAIAKHRRLVAIEKYQQRRPLI